MSEKLPLIPCPVLEPPSEIRNQIWRYAVVKNSDVKIKVCNLQRGREPRGYQADDGRRMDPSPLALALTSRQLYLEAALFYYSENIFDFRDACYNVNSTFKEIITVVGHQNASSITAARFWPTEFCFDGIYCHIDPFLTVLPGLKKIIIDTPSFARHDPLYASPGISLVDACAQSHPSAVLEPSSRFASIMV